MSDPSAYVSALAHERADYARSTHPDRAAMVDEELAAHGWAVSTGGDLVPLVEPKKSPPVPVRQLPKERAVAAALPEKALGD